MSTRFQNIRVVNDVQTFSNIRKSTIKYLKELCYIKKKNKMMR